MDASQIESKLEAAKSHLADYTKTQPEIGIVLGSGLGGLADKIENVRRLDYKGIPNFPVSTVAGHAGQLLFGELGGQNVVAMKGRVHYYEGYEDWQLAFPVRLLAKLGIKTLFASNAAGAVNADFKPGDLMLITDHINALGTNPLIGAHHEKWGPRFVDMSEPYSKELADKVRAAAKKLNLDLKEGVYYANRGPTYETAAEIKMVRTLGGDAVGMSTVPEIIIASQMGIRGAAISLITNMGTGMAEDIDHSDVMRIGQEKAKVFESLIVEILQSL